MQVYALVVNTVPWQITDFKRWTKRPNLRGNWGSFISPSHVMTASVSSPPLSVAMSRSPPLHTYYTPWVTQNKTTVIYFTVRLYLQTTRSWRHLFALWTEATAERVSEEFQRIQNHNRFPLKEPPTRIRSKRWLESDLAHSLAISAVHENPSW